MRDMSKSVSLQTSSHTSIAAFKPHGCTDWSVIFKMATDNSYSKICQVDMADKLFFGRKCFFSVVTAVLDMYLTATVHAL